MQFNTPILLVVFNREDTIRRVFAEIKKLKPKYLYIAADGPRENRIGEKEKCERVRSIVNEIDWDCEVHKLFHEKNLGCHTAVPAAISWFFENVEKGIILEDDCLPNQSFFYYCEELLEKYKDEEKIMMISGTNFLEKTDICESYFFSKYAYIWGWATWKRAWSKFDNKMESYPHLKAQGFFNRYLPSISEKYFWKIAFTNKYSGLKEGWDVKWIYALISNKALSITPKYNLIQNIGFTQEATNTNVTDTKGFVIQTHELPFPLVHNSQIEANSEYDYKTFKQVFLSTVSCKMILAKFFPALK